jgi:hypothetical protein
MLSCNRLTYDLPLGNALAQPSTTYCRTFSATWPMFENEILIAVYFAITKNLF